MKCLKCKEETKLLECKEDENGMCDRSWKCLECNFTFSTIEKPVDDFIYRYAHGYMKLLDAVNRLGKKDWLE